MAILAIFLLKTNSCAFKHADLKTDVTVKDFEKEFKIWTDDIKRLKSEITELKNDIIIKEKHLSERRMDIRQLTLKLAVNPNNKQEKTWKMKILIKKNT